MVQVSLKARANVFSDEILFEFGSTQARTRISSRGLAARKLKLKTGDKVEITIKKV